MNIHTTIECLITSALTLEIPPLQHSEQPATLVLERQRKHSAVNNPHAGLTALPSDHILFGLSSACIYLFSLYKLSKVDPCYSSLNYNSGDQISLEKELCKQRAMQISCTSYSLFRGERKTVSIAAGCTFPFHHMTLERVFLLF